MVRIRRVVLRNVAKKLKGRDVYQQCFDSRKIIFIHVPKAAGTSIAKAVLGKDPWHYSARELFLISPIKFQEYFKFAFVRNPWDRIYSTYNYSFRQVLSNPGTSVGFVCNYDSFEDFVMHGLTEQLVAKHYFLWPQKEYLCWGGKLRVDFVGKFETIHQDFMALSRQISIQEELPRLNVSGSRASYKSCYTPKMKDKIWKLYRSDMDFFCYEF